MSFDRGIYKALLVIFIIIVNVFIVSFSSADAPTEKFYVRSSDINEEVLKDMIGVLSVTVLGFYARIPQPSTPVANPIFSDNPYIFTPKFDHLVIFKYSANKFVREGTLKFVDMFPISGVTWFGFLSDGTEIPTKRLRFPVVQKRGDYRQIVYNPIRNLKTWIKLSEIDKAIKSFGFKDSKRTTGEIYFNKNMEEEEGIFVDLFFLTKKGTRKLYQAPDENSKYRRISRKSRIFPNEETLLTHSFITVIKNGFALLSDIDPCGDQPVRSVGWIKIRDEEGRLTVWPSTPLSC